MILQLLTLAIAAGTFWIVLQIALALKGVQEKIATSGIGKLLGGVL